MGEFSNMKIVKEILGFDADIDIVVPFYKENREFAEKVAVLHSVRAGVPVNVYLVQDMEGIGWVAMQNWAFKHTSSKYYIYSCCDYVPGKLYVTLALKAMKDKVKLVGFNDGKWRGLIATVGLIEREWAQKNYDGNLLDPVYRHHWADTELTILAQEKGVYGYNPNAVLFEVDYSEKNKPCHPPDNLIYIEREREKEKCMKNMKKQ